CLSRGCVVSMYPGFQMLVGGTVSTSPGGLYAVGTSGSHIRFEKGGSTQWESIYFRDYTIDASTHLSYCEFDNGGSSTAAVVGSNASPAFSNLTFTPSQNHCI